MVCFFVFVFLVFLHILRPPSSTLFPYTTLFRSHLKNIWTAPLPPETELSRQMTTSTTSIDIMKESSVSGGSGRSEERFSRNAETDLVCRLLLEKKKPSRLCDFSAHDCYALLDSA